MEFYYLHHVRSCAAGTEGKSSTSNPAATLISFGDEAACEAALLVLALFLRDSLQVARRLFRAGVLVAVILLAFLPTVEATETASPLRHVVHQLLPLLLCCLWRRRPQSHLPASLQQLARSDALAAAISVANAEFEVEDVDQAALPDDYAGSDDDAEEEDDADDDGELCCGVCR